MPQLTPEALAAIFGAVLSLLVTYVPGFNGWYASKPEDQKKALMALGLIVVSIGVFALSCAPVLGLVQVECSTKGAVDLLGVLIAALMANQTTDRLAPEPAVVKIAKARAKS